MKSKPLVATLVAALITPSFVSADPFDKWFEPPGHRKHHKHKDKYRDEVHVIHHHKRKKRYRKDWLPEAAALAVIAGISYAIIDGQYYKRKGDEYYLVDEPPKHKGKIGKIVDSLPAGATVVHKRGEQYFVANGRWYSQLANGKYVIVKPLR